MKYYKKVIALFSYCLTLCSCSNSNTTAVFYRYDNTSGVEVALVGEVNEIFNIPDSLVLQSESFIDYKVDYGTTIPEDVLDFPYKNDKSTPIKVYFNNKYCVNHIDNQDKTDDRNLYNNEFPYSSYMSIIHEEEKSGKIHTTYKYTYVFSPEDYQNAIKAQTKH